VTCIRNAQDGRYDLKGKRAPMKQADKVEKEQVEPEATCTDVVEIIDKTGNMIAVKPISNLKTIDINKAHNQMGHKGEALIKKTLNNIGHKVTGTLL
jgi:hypothetical protein